MVRDSLDTGLLRRLPIPVGGKLSDFGVLTRKSEPLGPAALELVALMRVYAARMTTRNLASLKRARKPPARR